MLINLNLIIDSLVLDSEIFSVYRLTLKLIIFIFTCHICIAVDILFPIDILRMVYHFIVLYIKSRYIINVLRFLSILYIFHYFLLEYFCYRVIEKFIPSDSLFRIID